MTKPTSICDKCKNECKATSPRQECALFNPEAMTAEEIAERFIRKEWGLGDDTTPTLASCPLGTYHKDLAKKFSNILKTYGSQCRQEGYDDGVKKSPCHMAMLNAYEQGREDALEMAAKHVESMIPIGTYRYAAREIRSLKEKKG